jgi:hypothetical protein
MSHDQTLSESGSTLKAVGLIGPYRYHHGVRASAGNVTKASQNTNYLDDALLVLQGTTSGPAEPSVDRYVDRHERALPGGVVLAEEVP